MNSNRFSARSGESTNGGNTVLNALISGGRGMQRTSSEASVTGGLGSVAPVVQAVNALNNAVNAASNNNNAASSVGSFSPGRRINNNAASSVGSFSPGRRINNNAASSVGINNNAASSVGSRNNMNMLMNMNDAELAAFENFAMSPGTPSHRNKKAQFNYHFKG